MGTAVSFDIRDDAISPGALLEAIEWLHHVDATFSTYDMDSTVSKIGLGELELADASEEVQDVFQQCAALKRATRGSFNIYEVPAPNGAQLDPSGFVKGWAIERTAEILETHGCENFSINAGGDIALRGEATANTPWTIGIRHPEEPNHFAVVVEGRGRLAIATSATYERGLHITDPLSGRQANSLASATVVGPDLGLADAYATALFVMGIHGVEWITERTGYDAYVITHGNETYWSDGFSRYRYRAAG